jgi:NADH-quinone oxidoreductase subunit E
MISESERKEIEAAAARFPTRRAAALEALMVVQKSRGWVSDEGLRDVAPLVDMTVDELDGLASFYSLIFRKEVGRHVILICDSLACWIVGAENLRERLTERLGIGLGETSPDGRFTLIPAACLGACDHAPVMLIDGDLHGDLTPDSLDAILDRYE